MNEITYLKITGDVITADAEDPDGGGGGGGGASATTTMQQALVFTHTRKDTGDTAKALLEMATERGQPERFVPGGGQDRYGCVSPIFCVFFFWNWSLYHQIYLIY